MPSKRLIVLYGAYRYPRRSKPVAIFVERNSARDTIHRIFGYIHHYASHSLPTLRYRWKAAEKRMLRRFAPDLYRLHKMKIKRERL